MASLLCLIRSFLNSLLPFTNPQTPILQDLVHSLALIALFYYGPRLAEQRAQRPNVPNQAPEVPEADGEDAGQEQEMIFEDEVADEVDAGAEDNDRFQPRVEHEDDPDAGPAANPDSAPDNDFQPGPAQPGPARARDRNVGAKKARALARRDQRRAYNEFLRNQGDIQRAQDAEGATEREEALYEEKRRRAVIEMELEEKARKEREEAKRKIEEERHREYQRRENIVQQARDGLNARGFVDLKTLGDMTEVQALVKAAGLLGTRSGANGKETTLITGEGWLVTINEATMRALYGDILKRESGETSFTEAGKMLETLVRAQSGRA